MNLNESHESDSKDQNEGRIDEIKDSVDTNAQQEEKQKTIFEINNN